MRDRVKSISPQPSPQAQIAAKNGRGRRTKFFGYAASGRQSLRAA